METSGLENRRDEHPPHPALLQRLSSFRDNVMECCQIPSANKICYESIFCDSQAPIETPNPALTVPLFSFHERRTVAVQV